VWITIAAIHILPSESILPALTSTATAAEFSSNIGATVSDFVAALHRINTRRGTNVAAESFAPARSQRYDSPIPNLAAQFGYVAWRS
jgi:hypothetical protein